MDPQSVFSRPSGIPKPQSTRLPVLRPHGSQSCLRPAQSSEQLRKKSSIPSISRAGQPQSVHQKVTPSGISLARSTAATTTASDGAASNKRLLSSSTKQSIGIPSGIPSVKSSAGRPRATSITNDASVFKRPFARHSSRQTKVLPQETPAFNTNGDNDVLGSLNGFRSASRASSRAGSRAGFYDDTSETEHTPEEEIRKRGGSGNGNEPEPEMIRTLKSRPSLSERTIESLSQLPSSPAAGKTRRRSSFFSAENTMPTPLRPASAMSNSSRSNSRPTTSEGATQTQPATPKRYSFASSRSSMTAPGKRSISANITAPLMTPSKPVSVSRFVSTAKKPPPSQIHSAMSTPTVRPNVKSKSMIARTPKTRPSLAGAFSQSGTAPGMTATTANTPYLNRNPAPMKTPDTSRKVSNSSLSLREHVTRAKAARKSDVTAASADVAQLESMSRTGSSSNALREQIMKAKEAARRSKAEPQRPSTPSREAIIPDPVEIASFDFGLDDDPFNQRENGSKTLLRKRIDGARVEGRLNIAAMGFREMPDDVLNMYQYNPDDTTIAWGDMVDMTVLIAADNELKVLPDAMFPDIQAGDLVDSDETGSQFAGLQTIDLHGNALRELPVGLRHLQQLSKLNLSRNTLSMAVFSVISQLPTLRELKLAENGLHGELSIPAGTLIALEVLELQNNQLTSMSAGLGKLSRLRSVNVSDNLLENIPMAVFSTLIELRASNNRLEGTLFNVDSCLQLQELHLANNSITSFCLENTMHLPALKTLNLSTNKLTSLPDMSKWTSLQTLLIGENKLTVLPDGFTSLTEQLRVADFNSNSISRLDEKVALMQGLQILDIAANPLRERKFLSMSTEELQRELSCRLQRDGDLSADQNGYPADESVRDAESSIADSWHVAPSGTLDLASKSLSIIDEEKLKTITGQCRQLYLQQNLFDSIPLALSQVTHLSVLDLSKNNMETAMSMPVVLANLRDLRLANNKISSLIPLTIHLTAPALQILDVSQNRLSGSLLILRSFFPELSTLLASDNSLSEVSAESLSGYRVVDLSNNDIERLEPHIGMLQGSLTSLGVTGNKFRVPSYQILGKGTDAVLTWLKDKIPRESWRSDGTESEFFDAID